MLCFTLTGTVGRVRPQGGATLIAVSSKRLVQNAEPAIEWVVAVARDQRLRAEVQRRLKAGDAVRIEGEIEPRRRKINGTAFYDVVFVARLFEKLPSPASEAQP
jgi:hypothetical protein